MSERKTVYFTMVCHPVSGWTRVGNAYKEKATASSWVRFVKKAWRGLPVRVKSCTLWYEDGKLTETSRHVLDKTFNLDTEGM